MLYLYCEIIYLVFSIGSKNSGKPIPLKKSNETRLCTSEKKFPCGHCIHAVMGSPDGHFGVYACRGTRNNGEWSFIVFDRGDSHRMLFLETWYFTACCLSSFQCLKLQPFACLICSYNFTKRVFLNKPRRAV